MCTINNINNNSSNSTLTPSVTITTLSDHSASSNMGRSKHNYGLDGNVTTTDRSSHFRGGVTVTTSYSGFPTTESVNSNTPSADSPYETENGAQKMRISRLRKTAQFNQIKDSKVYIALSARCERGSFHPTLLICVDKQRIEGKGWNTNNAAGGWEAQLCSFDDVLLRKNLVLLYEVGQLNRSNLGACEDKLLELEADGTHSLSTQGSNPSIKGFTSTLPMIAQSEFDGPTYSSIVSDSMRRMRRALFTLQEAELITVHRDLDGIEGGAVRTATHLEHFVVSGGADATIY